MKRRSRLSRSRDFDAVYRQGRSAASRYVIVYAFRRPPETEDSDPRAGFAVPRQVGSAVDRNGVKRRLRAVFEELQERLDPQTDYVLVARPGLAEAAEAQGFDWLRGEVGEVLARAGADRSGR